MHIFFSNLLFIHREMNENEHECFVLMQFMQCNDGEQKHEKEETTKS